MRLILLRPAFRISYLLLLLAILSAGCSARTTVPTRTAMAVSDPARSSLPPTLIPQSTATVQALKTSTSENTPDLAPTLKATATLSAVTRTPAQTATAAPTPTTPQIQPPIFLSQARTPAPDSSIPISLKNLNQLTQVAQWGRGTLQRIEFLPDGKLLLAASPFGIATYSLDDFDQPPLWMAFESPIFFQDLRISKDGTLVRLEWPQAYPQTGTDSTIFNLVTQKLQPDSASIEWLSSQRDQTGGFEGMTVISTDGKLRFEGQMGYQEENMNIQTFAGLIYDHQTGAQRTQLKDASFYVQYEDFNAPEGCDLASFSMCGNVYDPNIMAPYRVEFASSGRWLAILYRPPNLYNSRNFSILRLYATQDGRLIDIFGSFDQPVQDFAFHPGGDLLSIAFLNGSIQIWDTASRKLVHQTWNFSPQVRGFAFSNDGHYLVVQYADAVEVLRTSDGAIAGRYEASAFALSPRENLLALGSQKGNLQVENLDQRKTVSRMAGHTAVIYALAFSPDGQTLTSSSEDCTIRSWDARTGRFQHYFEKAEVDAIGEGWTKSRIFVYYMRFLPGSNQLVGFGSWGTAASWNVQSGAKEYAVVSQPLEYYNGMQTLNPYFPQSFWVVSEESRFYIDGTAYDLKSGEVAGGYTPPANLPEGCSPAGSRPADGSILFTPGYGDLAGQICILDAQEYRLLYRVPLFSGQSGAATDIAEIFLSPDGSRLYAASADGPVFVYQVP